VIEGFSKGGGGSYNSLIIRHNGRFSLIKLEELVARVVIIRIVEVLVTAPAATMLSEAL
jgi:hypothetical protein